MSYALSRLAAGDEVGFHDVLGPTVPLSRHIFKAPTRFYKTGVVFMAYLNGHQDHFTMVGGQESARSGLPMFRFANVKIDSAGLERILPSRDGTYMINRIRGDLSFRPI